VGPRWRKVVADLIGNKTRTAMVALSIAVGAFSVGTITTSYALILQDMDAQYQAVVPYSAFVAAEPFGDDVVEAIRDIPGVREAEGRSFVPGRVQMLNGQWTSIQLISIPSIEDLHLNRLRPINIARGGLGDQEVYLEKSLVGVTPTEIGGTLVTETTDRKIKRFRIAGTVEDLTLPPYPMAQTAWAYVTYSTMESLTGEAGHNTVYFAVRERPKDEEHVRAVAQAITDKLERSGHRTFFAFVFRPGEHWGSSIVQAMLTLLGVLGFLAVLLGGFLVVNTISALIGQQIRQIGVMKAIGAMSRQIVVMYLGLVLSYSVVALVIAVPLSTLAGFAFARGFLAFFGFEVSRFRIPPESLILQVAVAFAVPLVAGTLPVLSGTRITVREAVSDYGIGGNYVPRGLIDRLIDRIRGLSRPTMLSIRNAFLKKRRMALTLTTLSLAGAVFMSVFNVRVSFAVAADEVINSLLANVNITLSRPQRVEAVERTLMALPDVDRVEGWLSATGQMLTADGKSATDVSITAPPGGSELIKPVMTEGRWLQPDDQNALVVSNLLTRGRPDVRVGETVTVKVAGKESTWIVIGAVKLAGNFLAAPVYANYGYLAGLTGLQGRSSEFRLRTRSQDPAIETNTADEAKAALLREGMRVADTATGSKVKADNRQSFDIVILFLMIMSMLIAAVGGLGLMGTMSINVLERTREIGVIRAIGASTGSIVRMVVTEGVLIGILSWLIGSVLSLPISYAMCYAVGVAFLAVPMALNLSLVGFAVWLVLVAVIAALASVLPALNASRITVREALAYE